LLEGQGLIDKSEFDQAEALINDCRRNGLLPYDFTATDAKRATLNQEDGDITSLDGFVTDALRFPEFLARQWKPILFWDDAPIYVELLVEKIDLQNLFADTCAAQHVLVTNAGGWSDINERGQLLERFRDHDDGRRLVLLAYGDHDPAGLHIVEKLRGNLEQLKDAEGVNWDPHRIEVMRIGLTHEYIEKHRLHWIDNLVTSRTNSDGSARDLADASHCMHDRQWVQDYIAKYEARKVEANAILADVDAARADLAATLEALIPNRLCRAFDRKLAKLRSESVAEVRRRMRGVR
jgi:hypothetical protein